ncbi:MAG: PQQ-binding-like beta-propeller repeat protein [Croceibacterium sp.]
MLKFRRIAALLLGAVRIAAPLGLLSSAGLAAQSPDRAAPPSAPVVPFAAGAAIYQAHCASCHENPGSHAPAPGALGMLAPESIVRALATGPMKQQGAALSAGDKALVAQFIAKRPLGTADAVAGPLRCKGPAAQFDWSKPPVFPGWGLDAGNTHSISARTAGIGKANVARLRLKWAFAFPNAINAHSQPALAGGAIYVGGNDGTLYALDQATGCARWTYAASAAVRTGVIVSPWRVGNRHAAPLVYFGDTLGNAYALDAVTGKLKWKRSIDAHPTRTMTGTPALHNGVLYVPVSSLEEPAAIVPTYACCTFRGSLLALDAMTGAVRWRSYLIDKPATRVGTTPAGAPIMGPSGVSTWSTPVVDDKRNQIYLTTGDNYSQPSTRNSDAIVALDKATGRIKWASQVEPNDVWNAACMSPAPGSCPKDNGPDHDFGSAAILTQGPDGQSYILAGQKSGVAYALNPDTGRVVWQRKVGRGGVFGGIHFGIAAANELVYLPVSDFPDGVAPDADARPGLYALKLATGEPVWSAPAPHVCGSTPLCQPGYSAAISVTPELVFAGSTDGHLRIFDALDGALLWDKDTNVAFTTVNGTMAHGGSISAGAAPLAAGGQLIVNSGYGFLSKMPGNVLLVFDVK